MKRIVLFLVTNLAIMLVLSVTLRMLGVDRFMSANGLNVGMLLIFSLVVGFGGSFISLLMSKPIAKWSTGAQLINGSEGPEQRWLVETPCSGWRSAPASACRRLRSMKASPTHLPPVHFGIPPWWRYPPACCNR